MAKTSYVQIPEGLEGIYKIGLQSGNRYIFPRIIRKHRFISRAKKTALMRRQLITQAAILWKAMDPDLKNDWIAAAAENGQRGYSLFVQDQIFRIKYGIGGQAEPNQFHQYKVGRLVIEEPSDSIRIAQFHPSSYYLYKKISGTKSQYEYVPVSEILTLPLELSINYKSNLIVDGPNPKAKFYAEVYSNYQGNTLVSVVECSLVLESNWVNANAEITEVIGDVVGYNIFIDINDCHGTLWFDDVSAFHTATNWVRDHRCNAIDRSFTKQYYQVPRHWVPQIISDDAYFDSVYPN